MSASVPPELTADRLPDLPTVKALAARHLAPLGDRWIHSRAVGARAAELSAVVPAESRHLLIVAGWLHDIGYSPAARATGLHALDGARWLAGASYPRRLCALVAHHSAAIFEAGQRGLSLSEWDDEASPVRDALWVADMTTGPVGERLTYAERLDEITARYAEDAPAYQAMINARPVIEAAFERTAARLGRPVSPGTAPADHQGRDQSEASSMGGSSAR